MLTLPPPGIKEAKMILLGLALVAMVCWGLLIAGFALVNKRSASMAPAVPALPKAVPPFPFGPISDLIKDAERRAEEEHYALFPEERPEPEPPKPDEYSMGSGPAGIIRGGYLTPNERREIAARWQKSVMRGNRAMVLGENMQYHPIDHHVAESLGMPPRHIYSRYVERLGIVTADSEEKLARAIEVALVNKYKNHEAALRAHDHQLKALMGIPHASITRPKEEALREARRYEWEQCRLVVEQLNALNEEQLRQGMP